MCEKGGCFQTSGNHGSKALDSETPCFPTHAAMELVMDWAPKVLFSTKGLPRDGIAGWIPPIAD
jgi:hypothetical protein